MKEHIVTGVKEAAKIVMKYYGKPKGLQFKSRIDPVTSADLESEKFLIRHIKEKYPDHGFIVEETDNQNIESEFIWYIDPLDGTANFSHNYPVFCVSVALYKNNHPMLGIVYAPIMNELFIAEKGKGATLNGNPIKVSSIKNLHKSLILTGFPYSRLDSDVDNLNNFNRMAKKAGSLRRSGSAAIDLCYVACGRADGYWEIMLKSVDAAAGRIMVEEAGGTVTNNLGEPIKKDYSFVVASNNKIHNKMLKTFGE